MEDRIVISVTRLVGHLFIFIVTRCLDLSVTIANTLTFVIVTALMQNSKNVHQQLQNMRYTPILLSCTKKRICLLDVDCAVLSCSFLHTIRLSTQNKKNKKHRPPTCNILKFGEPRDATATILRRWFLSRVQWRMLSTHVKFQSSM